jgi:hypothetical protein
LLLVALAAATAPLVWLATAPAPPEPAKPVLLASKPPASALAPRTVELPPSPRSSPARSAPLALEGDAPEITKEQAQLRAAFATANALADPQARAQTLGNLCYRWAAFDPPGAVNLAFDYQLEEAPGGILENLAQQWAAVDLQAVRTWIDAQTPGDLRSRIVARIGFLWAQSDPAAAAAYIVEKIPPGSEQTEAAISVIYQWTRQDPEAATAWARNFPAGPLRDRALKEALAGVSTRTDN